MASFNVMDYQLPRERGRNTKDISDQSSKYLFFHLYTAHVKMVKEHSKIILIPSIRKKEKKITNSHKIVTHDQILVNLPV